jgi:hypothetical protein
MRKAAVCQQSHRTIYRLTALMESNVPLETIKAWVGHGSEAMIRRYAHLRP